MDHCRSLLTVILRRAAVAAAILSSAVAFLPGCGKDEEKATSPASQPEDSAARELKAREMLKIARGAAFPEKTQMVREVARTFWDTESAPAALVDLIAALFDEHTLDPMSAIAEIETFARRRPDRREIVDSFHLAYNACDRVVKESKDAEKVEAAKKAMALAAKRMLEEAERFSAIDKYKEKVELIQVLGQAHFANGNWKAADVAWERVESLTTDVLPIRRFESLMWRADLADSKLNDPKKALELFKKADALSSTLDTTADDNWGEYVRRRIKEIEAKVLKN